MMTFDVNCLILLISSYLFGSISFAILVTKAWTGEDIREIGNLNAGAANVGRCVGLLPGAIVAVMDFAKGALPVLVARMLGLGEICALAGIIVAVLGHSYPIYFGFRGGRGLSTVLGGLLALTPVESFLILLLFGLIYLVITGSAIIASIVSLLALSGVYYLQNKPLLLILAPLVFLLTMASVLLPRFIRELSIRGDKRKVLTEWLRPKGRVKKAQQVAIITDSIASLPVDLRQREHIHMVPLALILPGGVCHDGVDVDTRQFYQDLRAGNLDVKTSAPSPGEFLDLFRKLSQDHEAAIVISPPKELTHTWSSAHLAAQEIGEDFPVFAVDSRTAGPAQGFIALAAARLGQTFDEPEPILEALETVMKRVGFAGVLDTLELLIKGGRVRDAQYWAKSRLRVFPVLAINDSQIRLLGMARSKEKARTRLLDWLKKTLPKGQIALAVCHTDAADEADQFAKQLSTVFHPVDLFVTELPPIIGAHAGPGLLGVAWWVQSDES